MLTHNQRYAIASSMAVSSLETVIARLLKHGKELDHYPSEEITFARSINVYFGKRDGYIPKQVLQLCK